MHHHALLGNAKVKSMSAMDLYNIEPDQVALKPSLDQSNIMRREIELDGDRYLLTIPSARLITGMKKSESVIKAFFEEGDDLTFTSLILQNLGTEYHLAMSDRPDNHIFVWAVEDGEIKEFPAEKMPLVTYRPVLIPLDKNGNIDFSMRTTNPDGSIAEGGQMILAERERRIPIGLLFSSQKAKKVEFHDSNTNENEENLKWVWYHGLMINLCPTTTIYPSSLLRQRLISDTILYPEFYN